MRKHLFAEGFAGFLVTVSVTFPILSMVNLSQVPKRFKRVMFNKFYAGILVDMTEKRIYRIENPGAAASEVFIMIGLQGKKK